MPWEMKKYLEGDQHEGNSYGTNMKHIILTNVNNLKLQKPWMTKYPDKQMAKGNTNSIPVTILWFKPLSGSIDVLELLYICVVWYILLWKCHNSLTFG